MTKIREYHFFKSLFKETNIYLIRVKKMIFKTKIRLDTKIKIGSSVNQEKDVSIKIHT